MRANYAYAASVAAREPGMRTRAAVADKRDAKAALRFKASDYSKLVQGTATVTDGQKQLLGLNVKAPASLIPAPVTSPAIEVKSVVGNVVSLRLKGTTTARGGKPAGVVGATVFTFIGETPPANINDWFFQGSSGKTRLTIEFPLNAEPFSRMWITAFWKIAKDQSGPATAPISTNLGTWLAQNVEEEQEQLRKAA